MNSRTDVSKEIHYTPLQIAALWGSDAGTVRELFRNEPGVLRIAKGKKGARETIRIPASVVERVHRRLEAA